MQVQEKFSYSAQPHAAPMKKKYRNPNGDESEKPNVNEIQNIMYDARVIRGNTYSAKIMSSSLKTELEIKKSSNNKRKNVSNNFKRKGNNHSRTPSPVSGRNHMTMQTDDFLEEITDRPIEQDAETQTLPFMDKPPFPLFVRAKIGMDVTTQIENGDLFDFDLEVEPILEVLVGKTIHVSMLELMQEEELEAIQLQQQEFETIRNIELAEVQRLESEIKRKALEKERRIAQEIKRVEDRHRLEETIAARAFADQFLGDLHLNVFDMLQEQGHFYDPLQREVEDHFMGDLINNLLIGSNAYDVANQMAMELIDAARTKAKLFEKEAIALRKEMLARIAEEEALKLKLEEEARLAAEAAAAAAEAAGEVTEE
eukprot:gene5290-7352_t